MTAKLHIYKKNSPLYAAMRFVTAAIKVEATRYTLTHILVSQSSTKGCIDVVATDGRRMHLATMPDVLPTGFYEVVKRNLTLVSLARVADDVAAEFTFPKWRDIVPEDGDRPYLQKVGTNDADKLVGISVGILARDDILVNPALLDPVAELAESGVTDWDVRYGKDSDSVVFTAATKSGLEVSYTVLLAPIYGYCYPDQLRGDE